jgi:hypothetical protein
MELAQNELIDALSLTRERVRVWVLTHCRHTGAEEVFGQAIYLDAAPAPSPVREHYTPRRITALP